MLTWAMLRVGAVVRREIALRGGSTRNAKGFSTKRRPYRKVDRPPPNLRYPIGEWYKEMEKHVLDDVLTRRQREKAREGMAR